MAHPAYLSLVSLLWLKLVKDCVLSGQWQPARLANALKGVATNRSLPAAIAMPDRQGRDPLGDSTRGVGTRHRGVHHGADKSDQCLIVFIKIEHWHPELSQVASETSK
jgi:hypothetical protein